MTTSDKITDFVLWMRGLDLRERKRVVRDLAFHFCLQCGHFKEECDCSWDEYE